MENNTTDVQNPSVFAGFYGTDGEPDNDTKSASDKSKNTEDENARLKKEVQDLNAHIKKQSRQIADLTENFTGTQKQIEGIKNVFSPQDDSNEKIKQLQKQYDEDPFSATNTQLSEIKSEMESRINKLDRRLEAKHVMDKLDKQYNINWNKDSEKIMEELDTFDVSFKINDPQAAILKAAKLAGVNVEKRREPNYTESASLSEKRERAKKTFADDFKKRLLKARDKRGGSVFKKMQRSFTG